MKLHGSYNNTQFYIDRSKQVLLMRSNGKTIEHIADKLSISSRRVESIIQDLRTMNNCVNECHLIATAIRSGMIQ